jgi:nucleoside phosphorylase
MCKIKLLLVDDNSYKTGRINEFLDKKSDVLEYSIVTDANSCKQSIAKEQYDILLLDLLIPLRFGDEPNAKNAINVINEINRRSNFKSPIHIIIHSAFDECLQSYASDLSICELIHFHQENNAWEKQLNLCIEHCYKFKNYYQAKIENSSFDVALIAALQEPELEQILKLNGGNWAELNVIDGIPCHTTKFTTLKNKELNIVAVACKEMGMVAATDLTNKVLQYFNPKAVIIGGIAAGFKGNFGDILIAQSCYDHGNGKLETKKRKVEGKIQDEEVFLPDIRQITIESKLEAPINELKRKKSGLLNIHAKWTWDDSDKQMKKLHIDKKLRIEFGPFASGAGVVASKKYVEKNLKSHARKLIGIDMEAYGVYYACKNSNNHNLKYFLSIKSKSDNGDNKKNDKYQAYAAYTSAQYIYYLLTQTDLLKFE